MQHCNKQIIILPVLLLGLLALHTSYAKAQREGDSVGLMRRFITVSNVYKKLPVRARINIKATSDFVESIEDTSSIQAEFYVYKEGTYVKMGDEEQMTNDSQVLFIRNHLKLMSLYPAGPAVKAQLKNAIGIQVNDSALEKMIKANTITVLPGDANNQNISKLQLTSRTLVYGTHLPIQAVQLVYDTKTGVPVEATQVSRRLIEIDSAVYQKFLQDPLYAGRLVTTDKGYHLVLKEKTITYTYSDVAFDENKPLPLQILTCLVKNADGRYVSAKGYEQYRVKMNY